MMPPPSPPAVLPLTVVLMRMIVAPLQPTSLALWLTMPPPYVAALLPWMVLLMRVAVAGNWAVALPPPLQSLRIPPAIFWVALLPTIVLLLMVMVPALLRMPPTPMALLPLTVLLFKVNVPKEL